MRFMVQVRASADSEAGVMPRPELFEAMDAFNQELVGRGMMLAGEGLHDSGKGVRLNWSGSKLAVQEGPFPVNEVVSGFWIVQAASRDEVVEIFKRCPPPADGGEGSIEIRQVFDAADFEGIAPPDVIEREEAWRKVHEKPVTA